MAQKDRKKTVVAGRGSGLTAKGIQSVEIGIELLKTLAAQRQLVSLRDLAKAAGMSPSKARMYLVSLIRTGLVAQDDATGEYALGDYATELGMAALDRDDLLHLAEEALTDLSRTTGATVLLLVWSETGPVIVRRREGSEVLPIDFRIGGHGSLTRTATGRVFLAFLPDGATAKLRDVELGENKQHRHLKQIDEAFLSREVEKIRRQGFASTLDVRLSSGLVLSGYSAVAAPIFDHSRQMKSAITVLFSTAVAPKSKELVIERIVEATQKLSKTGVRDAPDPRRVVQQKARTER